MARPADSHTILRCSFCGKSQYEVQKLIAGPTVFICSECIELCNDILKEESKKQGPSGSTLTGVVPSGCWMASDGIHIIIGGNGNR